MLPLSFKGVVKNVFVCIILYYMIVITIIIIVAIVAVSVAMFFNEDLEYICG